MNIRHSFISVAGVVGSQAANFLSILLIGKVCGPAVLGEVSQLTAIGLFLGSVIGLRLEYACMSSEPAAALRAFANSSAVALAISALLAAGAALAGHADVMAAIGLGFGAFLQQALGAALTSRRRYTTIAVLRVLPNAVFVAYLIGIVALGNKACTGSDVFNIYGAIFVATTLAPALIYLLAGHGFFDHALFTFSAIQLRYARYGLPTTLLNSVVIYSITIAMPFLFGNRSAGLFALAYRIGYFPASLMSQSLGAVFRRDLIDYHEATQRHEAADNPTRPFLKLLIKISVALVAACYAGLAGIVYLKMGDEWRGSLMLYLLLAPYFVSMAIYGSMAQVFLALNRQKIDLVIQLLNAGCIFAILGSSMALHIAFTYAIALLSAAGTIVSTIGTFQALAVGHPRNARGPASPPSLAAPATAVGDANA